MFISAKTVYASSISFDWSSLGFTILPWVIFHFPEIERIRFGNIVELSKGDIAAGNPLPSKETSDLITIK